MRKPVMTRRAERAEPWDGLPNEVEIKVYEFEPGQFTPEAHPLGMGHAYGSAQEAAADFARRHGYTLLPEPVQTNYYRKLRWVEMHRYNRTRDRGFSAGEGIDFDPAVRAYKSSPHAISLQLRGPENLQRKASDVHGILATASMNRAEVEELIDRLTGLVKLLPED